MNKLFSMVVDGMCRHEITRDFLADNLMNLEKLPKTS